MQPTVGNLACYILSVHTALQHEVMVSEANLVDYYY